MKLESEVKVLTLNCWGLALISKDRIPRIQAIAQELASGNYDFVFLQEVWSTEDYQRIKSKTQETLPYSHYFHRSKNWQQRNSGFFSPLCWNSYLIMNKSAKVQRSLSNLTTITNFAYPTRVLCLIFLSGVIGAGICIFSRSPIISAFFHQWAVNGYVHKIQHGDWFGGKGIGMVQVIHKGLKYSLYTAHLHAEYDRVNDEYLAHRVTQAYDTAQFILLTSQSSDVVIVGGDLNTEPMDLAYRVILHTAQLRDTYFEKPKGNKEFYTCETPNNSYTSSKALKSNPFGKRIDYLLYSSHDCVQITTTNCNTPLPPRVYGYNFSFSDHEAVVATLKIIKSEIATPYCTQSSLKRLALDESVEICSQALKQLSSSRKAYYFIGTICLLLLLISSTFVFGGYINYLVYAVKAVLIILLVFSTFMSTIWYRMEVHGILAGKIGMELEITQCVPDSGPSVITSNEEWMEAHKIEPRIIMPKFK